MTINRLDSHHDPYFVWNVFAETTGKLAFDVGANIGQSTKVLAKGFKRVVAFEPHPESFDILNVEMPMNVEAKNFALTSVEGSVHLDVASYSNSTGQYVTGEGLHWGDLTDKVEVEGHTLDWCVEKFGSPSFVKIDTEGHEVEVVRGGPKLFASRPKAVIEIHKAENEKLIRQLLPEYEWLKVEHPLRVESPIRQNHFWLVSQ